MTALFKKLNLKDEREIVVLNAPATFQSHLKEISTVVKVSSRISKSPIQFALAFAITQNDVDSTAHELIPRLADDPTLWFAYPKGTSKKYKCEFNRDSGWNELGKAGFEPVRLIAIDDDWSALRFRKTQQIKKMTRKSAISEEGQRRIKKGNSADGA